PVRHSILRSAGEGLTELLAKFFKRAEHYSLPNPPHGVKVKVEVVQRVEGGGGHLAGDEKVPEVGSRKMPAGVARALRIGRRDIFGVPRVLDDERPAAREELAVSRVARREHAVEQVD